jgi:hypothetical protein
VESQLSLTRAYGIDNAREIMQAEPAGLVITVQVRNVFGNDLVYPADDAALIFARLIDARTFGARHLKTIRALGYAVHVSAGTLPADF